MKIPFRSDSLRAGLAVAVLHVLLIGSIYAKFQLDRASYPRVWVRTVSYDPETPFRGRYVNLHAVVSYTPSRAPSSDVYAYGGEQVRLGVRDGVLTAVDDPTGHHVLGRGRCAGEETGCTVLAEPIAFFIPEHADDPSRRTAGQELWVEATVPPTGPLRPIRLGVKANGTLTPLDID